MPETSVHRSVRDEGNERPQAYEIGRENFTGKAAAQNQNLEKQYAIQRVLGTRYSLIDLHLTR